MPQEKGKRTNQKTEKLCGLSILRHSEFISESKFVIVLIIKLLSRLQKGLLCGVKKIIYELLFCVKIQIMNSLFLKNIKIHPNWKPFLSKKIMDLILQIESDISTENFTPSPEKVLRFLELPLSSVKVVIVGQDPYPQPGAATGRAFEVGTLKSWNEPFRNISLKNILRALYKAYTGKALNYNEIKKKFDNEFPLLAPNKLFIHWEKQGVLLLNTSFTCELGIPGSHKKVWEKFSSELLNYINIKNSSIIWFLWGNHALEATHDLCINNKIISQHPMMCYKKEGRDTDFLFGKVNCFEQLINEIDWTGFNLSAKHPLATTLF